MEGDSIRKIADLIDELSRNSSRLIDAIVERDNHLQQLGSEFSRKSGGQITPPSFINGIKSVLLECGGKIIEEGQFGLFGNALLYSAQNVGEQYEQFPRLAELWQGDYYEDADRTAALEKYNTELIECRTDILDDNTLFERSIVNFHN